MALETLLMSAAAPAVLDLLKGVFGAASRKFLGMTVDDQVKLANSDIERMKALAGLDNPYGTPSQWVVDLRASFRYISAILVIGLGGVLCLDPKTATAGIELVCTPFGFIFGERLYLGLKGTK